MRAMLVATMLPALPPPIHAQQGDGTDVVAAKGHVLANGVDVPANGGAAQMTQGPSP